MVKSKKSDFRKNCNTKGRRANGARPKKINASTAYDTCSEQLSPFGGLWALIKRSKFWIWSILSKCLTSHTEHQPANPSGVITQWWSAC
ncbi:MAG: hypothetical protein JJV98_18545 [Desulfosarcina sp.]|nr:hypothetical protein [Desulfobacterales bacterium]